MAETFNSAAISASRVFIPGESPSISSVMLPNPMNEVVKDVYWEKIIIKADSFGVATGDAKILKHYSKKVLVVTDLLQVTMFNSQMIFCTCNHPLIFLKNY